MNREFFGVSAFACILLAGANALAQPTVTVDGVTIEGTVSTINSQVDEYYAIPYASADRWQPPRKPAALANPFDASHFSNVAVCPQPGTVAVRGVTLTQSEDCLSLNVYTPASAMRGSKLPVFVWIHGGGLKQGTGVLYDASNMIAANNIVVVTFNYRLGALGWLAQKAIRADASNDFENSGDAGDYGLMDQQFALAWVKDHIAAFGGDPSLVTVGGESAGGASVLLNLASTSTAAGLFRAAVVASGAFDFHDLPSQDTSESQFGDPLVDQVLAATGTVDGVACSSLTTASARAQILTCLRGTPVATILTAQSAVYPAFVTPNFGTLTVPLSLKKAFSTGKFIQVPVLQGTNANEGRFFEPAEIPFAADMATIVAAGGPANYDLTNPNSYCGGVSCSYEQEINLYVAQMNIAASENTPSFDATLATTDYPLSAFPDPYLSGNAPSADEGLAQIRTDYQFACNAHDADTDMTKYVTVYAYEFNDPEAPPSSVDPAVTVAPNDQYGYPTASEHAADLAFLFFLPQTMNFSSGELVLESDIQSYVANFVVNLDPSTGASVPAWPAFNGSREVQALVPAPQIPAPFTSFTDEHFCKLWQPLIKEEAQQ